MYTVSDSKVAICYTMKPLTVTPGGKFLNYHSYFKNGARYGKKVKDKRVQHYRFTTRKYLAFKNDANEKHKMYIFVAQLP